MTPVADLQTALRHEVRQCLKAAGLKQTHVAHTLHTTDTHLSRMLNGQARMNLTWAERIVELCGRELLIVSRQAREPDLTDDTEPRVQLVIDPTGGILAAYVDQPEQAAEQATATGAVVVDLPIALDARETR